LTSAAVIVMGLVAAAMVVMLLLVLSLFHPGYASPSCCTWVALVS
jgi:hypothetical protein